MTNSKSSESSNSIQKKSFRMFDLISYFLIANIFTWLFWIPDGLVKRGILEPSFFTQLGFLGSFGPLLAVIIMIFKEAGFNGLKSLFTIDVHKKFDKKWWIPILFLFPILITASYYVSVSIDGVQPVSEASGMYAYLPFIFFIVMFTGGPVQEEFGWRGYALPRLQEKFNPFIASLILGFIWAIWHWPQFLVPKALTGMFYVTPIWSFVLTVMAANFIYTWLYNRTNGSILGALVLHTQMNLFFWIFPVLYTSYGYLIILIVFVIVAMLTVLSNKNLFFGVSKS